MVSTHEKYAAAAQEDRSADRVRISIPAGFRCSGSKSLQTAVRDLSMSGFSTTAMAPLHRGTLCWLTLPGLETVKAKVVWWENGVAGCEFDQLLDTVALENILGRWREDGYDMPRR